MYTYNKILTEQSSYKIKHYRVINNNRNRILFEEIQYKNITNIN